MADAPPEVPAGKNLTVVSPSSRAAWISVAVTTPGRASTSCCWQRSTTARLRPGRDDEPGTGSNRLVDLLRGENGASADEDVTRGGHRPDALSGGGRAEGDLGHGETTRRERRSEWAGGASVVEDDYGDEPTGAQR
jgi:hypothetical protein